MPAAPIAILSYNRPQYLRPVLESLRQQTALGDPRRVHLFQDGPRADGAHAEERAACVAAFRETFPDGVLLEAPANLGIAFNFDRAERHVFETLDAELGYFFEDDLVLSPHYLAALDAMAGYALREPRIGYVAAYGVHAASEEERARLAGSIVNMGHKWGFALTRRHWLRIRPMVAAYLEMIGDRPYHERDSPRIRQYFASLGTAVTSTSQDAAKLIATVQAGATDVTCHDCYAHYIGRIGEHFRDRIYERMGYDRTRMAEGPPPAFAWPDDAALAALHLRARRSIGMDRPAAAEAAAPRVTSWPLSPADFVTEAYRGLLRREPEPQGLATHCQSIEQKQHSAARVLARIAGSDEFRRKFLAAPPPQAAPIGTPAAAGAPEPAAPPHPAPAARPRGNPAPLMSLLHGEDIFEGFAPTLPLDLQGWNSRHHFFAEQIAARRPGIVVDVGVWKGGSTVHLARAMRAAGIAGQVIAVDTFLGSPEHWRRDRADRIHEHLASRHGLPHLYWQFLSNIVHAGCQDLVVPLPQTSENAAVILKRLGVRVGLVHIDAAHEYEPVLRDAQIWWELLEPGGVMIGDDYTWAGVARAAEEFARSVGVPLEVSKPKWLLAKAA